MSAVSKAKLIIKVEGRMTINISTFSLNSLNQYYTVFKGFKLENYRKILFHIVFVSLTVLHLGHHLNLQIQFMLMLKNIKQAPPNTLYLVMPL